jgi:hypothetical protein
MKTIRYHAFALVLALVALTGCAELAGVAREISRPAAGGELDEQTVIAGLREALRVAAGRSVEQTGRQDGFLGNALIRIPLPQSYREVATGLRRIGLGGRVDELEVAMNRAAEQAAREAQSVLWQAVQSMTIEDAFGILRGSDTAATDYFRGRTSTTLQQRFQPIVQEKMEAVGLYRLHNELAGAYLALPFSNRDHLVDIDRYVTDGALEGLFTVLAQEEQRIRQDPIARTTDLLRRVFGQ